MNRIATVGLGLVTAVGVAATGFVWSFHTKFAPVQDRVRRLNRDVTNPGVLRRAGGPDADEAVVHHVGRVSATPYRTPVGAVPIADGFVVGLPYGPTADWVRNVVAAGAATVDLDGASHPVTRPELVGPEVAGHWFSAMERRVQRLFGVEDFLVLHHAEPAADPTAATASDETAATAVRDVPRR